MPTGTVRKYVLLIAGVVLALDRLSKWIIANTIPLHDSITVIPGLFKLTHVTNGGAAFGLFSDSPSELRIVFLIFFSLLALIVVSALLLRHTEGLNSSVFAMYLILCVAIGHSLYRRRTGYVCLILDLL